METKTKQLKKDLLNWYTNNKRSFSWRNTNDPWKILLIEIISQQTQIYRADTYYQKFIKRFPTPESMSKSSLKTILKMWSGLGYNNRAKRLYESAKLLAEQGFEGIYPNFEILPGVGPYTKNAILSFAYGDNVLAVDTNLQRIIIRYFGIDNTKDYFHLRHLTIFIIFFLSSIAFYQIIKKRFNNNFVIFLGLLFYIGSPRIF